MIPSVAVNNYLWRLPELRSHNSIEFIPILSQTSSNFAKEGSQLAIKCPMHLHLVLWNTNSSDISINIFQSKHLHHFSEISIENSSKQNFYSVRYFTYDESILSTDLTAKPRRVDLKIGDYGFIIKDHIITFASKNARTSELSSNIEGIYGACILDASNFNDFVGDALVAKQSYHEVSSHVEQIVTLDTTMLRILPSDLSLEEIGQLSITKSTLSTGNVLKEQTERTNRRNRKSSSQIKDWQEIGRWQTLITSLTISRPTRPLLLAIGRSNATIQWKSPFLPDKTDLTVFGFNISACLALEDSSSSSNHNTREDDCNHYSAYRQHDAFIPIAKVPLIETIDENEYESTFLATTTSFSAIIKGLRPNTKYTVVIRTFYSSYASLTSDPSELFATAPIGVPLAIPCLNDRSSCIYASAETASRISSSIIHFYQPCDDGGSAILGYHVYYKRGTDIWRYHGKMPVQHVKKSDIVLSAIMLEVSHLQPNTSYNFRIAAYNIIGNSSMSDSSNQVTTQSLRHINDRQLIRSLDLRHGASIVHASDHSVDVLKYLRVDDLEETITVVNPHTTNADLAQKVRSKYLN